MIKTMKIRKPHDVAVVVRSVMRPSELVGGLKCASKTLYLQLKNSFVRKHGMV